MTTINLSELFPARFRGVPLLLEETDVRTANYTLQFSDGGKVVPLNASVIITVTVPDNTTVDFAIGTVVNLYNLGSEVVNVVGANTVTVVGSGSLQPFGEVSLRKRDTNEWVVAGVLL
jgi:hypothetical protein